MRRSAALCLSLVLAAASGVPARAQGQAPHAWLFGTWTGGLFPPPQQMTTQACFSQPTVIFTRDLVMRAVLTQQELVQREVESARAMPGGTEFRLTRAVDVAPQLFGGSAAVGFGCPTANDLVVQKKSENEIAFPGCADFPYPLVRCH